MTTLFQPLLFLLAKCTEHQLIRQVEILKAQTEMLRERVPKKRIFLRPDEKQRLMNLAEPLGPSVRHSLTVVSYSTYRRWIREKASGKQPAKMGRPRISECLSETIVRIARETGWGYSRILGELKKLYVGRISRQTVKNILVENGLDPGPKRGRGTGGDFLRIHAETLWQCDFFSKRIWTLQGPRQVFALAFINVATRRVFVSPSTLSTNRRWMEQQAEAFLDHVRRERLPCTIVMRDHDGAFSQAFDQVFKDSEIRVKPVGPQAPNLNAFAERWIPSLKQEALDHFLVFGQEHFDHIVREYVDCYHDCRPHQGLGNVLLPRSRGKPEEEKSEPIPLDLAMIKCGRRLGGLLKHYHRDAA